MCKTMQDLGLVIEAHHHEVATCGQNEIATKFNSLTKKADEVMIYKYVVQNVAIKWAKPLPSCPNLLPVTTVPACTAISQSAAKERTFLQEIYTETVAGSYLVHRRIIKHAKL